jgi:hypothetical protein
MAGCNVQHGRFSTSTVRGAALSPYPGEIDIVSGASLTPIHSERGDEQNLLYIIFVSPGVETHGSSSSDDFGTYVTTLNRGWNTTNGSISVTAKWDRQADTVSVAKQEYNREKGNVFIVRCKGSGEISSQQLGSLGPHTGCQEVLQYIRQQLPNDQMIISLTLSK